MGAAGGAVLGAALGAPMGAGVGLMAVREKFVEQKVIPQVAQMSLAKGVEIGSQMQRAQDVAEFEAQTKLVHAQAGVTEQAKEHAVHGKFTKAYVNRQAASALATLTPEGRS
jgi:hypothetical protein